MNRNLNIDGQYQLNEQSPVILTEITEHKKTTTYDVRNPDPGLGQAGTNMWRGLTG